jgi:hypothetical protein
VSAFAILPFPSARSCFIHDATNPSQISADVSKLPTKYAHVHCENATSL